MVKAAIKNKKLLLLALTLVIAGASLSLVHKDGTRSNEKVPRKFIFSEVRPNDVKEVENWAALWCRGNTVHGLASDYGIVPKLDVVMERLSKGLPAKSRAAVKRVCLHKLQLGNQSVHKGARGTHGAPVDHRGK